MTSCKVKPYLGSEPFIFISYAHADKEKVYPIIEELDKRGYRLWYDEGIEPGSEWIKEIARRISESKMVLFFLSRNFFESYHCDKELRFSAGKEKEYIPAFIERLELPVDIEYLISSDQHVFRYEYTDIQHFLDKLCTSKTMECCLESREEAVTEAPPQKMKPRKEKKQGHSLPRKRKLILLAVCIALSVLLVLSLPFMINGENITITDDLVVRSRTTYLRVTGKTVTAELIENAAKLEDLVSLSFVDCTFEEKVTSEARLPADLMSLELVNCTGVDSTQFLSELTSLKELTLKGCGLTNDTLMEGLPKSVNSLVLANNIWLTNYDAIADLRELRQLDISYTMTKSLSTLSNLKLQVLDFSGTCVSSITPLCDMQTLTEIDGSDTDVGDITPLAALEELKSIKFDRCQIETPKEAFRSLRLETVSLAGNNLTNLDFLANCTLLKHVDLSGNQLNYIDNLHKSEATLEYLDLSGNPLSEDAYHNIQDFHQLKELYLNNIPTKKLVYCGEMNSLKRLSAAGCGIEDIQWYNCMSDLDYLCLANNRAADAYVSYSFKVSDTCTVDLSNNPVDVFYLPEGPYEVLILVGDEIDTSGISKVLKGKLLVIHGGLELTKRLEKDAFNEYVILNCPMDERIRVEEYFGAGTVTFLDDITELIEFLDQRNIKHWLSAQSEITQ